MDRRRRTQQELQADRRRFSFNLTLRSEKPPVIHGIERGQPEGRGSRACLALHLVSRGWTTWIHHVDGKQFTGAKA